MNETPKGKLQRLITKANRHGYNELCNADIEWSLTYATELEKQNETLQAQLDTINDDIPRLTARLSAQSDQVYRG